ncbi:Na+/H+ antiporter subunit E [Chthonobacter rhizosphaerae]|uniref:Na+/H+ antiporter subunit E n=1 Tax=Chthonobacter rhizosphaerae TaxID=2735553 RepID=UPI0015EFA073|nr:Na+/H+ antiporter subunit E [Chthonobacter rhizosphaerae]
MIHFLALAVVFSVVWTAVTGAFTIVNMLFGLALSAVALSLVKVDLSPGSGRVRPLKTLSLFGLFVVELLKSGWRVARTVVRRDMDLKPGMLAYPLTVTRDFEITLLANMITLTPGTLSVDVSADRRTLYVHCIDMPDADAVIADIRGGFEKKIMEAFR